MGDIFKEVPPYAASEERSEEDEERNQDNIPSRLACLTRQNKSPLRPSLFEVSVVLGCVFPEPAFSKGSRKTKELLYGWTRAGNEDHAAFFRRLPHRKKMLLD